MGQAGRSLQGEDADIRDVIDHPRLPFGNMTFTARRSSSMSASSNRPRRASRSPHRAVPPRAWPLLRHMGAPAPNPLAATLRAGMTRAALSMGGALDAAVDIARRSNRSRPFGPCPTRRRNRTCAAGKRARHVVRFVHKQWRPGRSGVSSCATKSRGGLSVGGTPLFSVSRRSRFVSRGHQAAEQGYLPQSLRRFASDMVPHSGYRAAVRNAYRHLRPL